MPARPGVPAEENPGLVLGTILGVAANHGIDKLTLIASPGIYDLGAWLEQLIAESTGKDGKGIIPVDREAVAPPSAYGDDRLFAYLRLEEAADEAQDAAVAALEKAGKPVVTIRVAKKYDLGEEFVRWEIATAIAGALIGIHPFNQPDVEASKLVTKALTSEYETSGNLPSETPFYEGEGVRLFADAKNVAALKQSVGQAPSLAGYLKAHLDRVTAGDYFALLAYIEMNAANEAALQRSRHRVRDRKAWPLASASGRGSSIRPARVTRAAPTAACSSRSRATTRWICRCLARSTPSASSRPPRRAATFRCWPSAIVARSGSISVRMWPRDSKLSSQRWIRRWPDHGE